MMLIFSLFLFMRGLKAFVICDERIVAYIVDAEELPITFRFILPLHVCTIK